MLQLSKRTSNLKTAALEFEAVYPAPLETRIPVAIAMKMGSRLNSGKH